MSFPNADLRSHPWTFILLQIGEKVTKGFLARARRTLALKTCSYRTTMFIIGLVLWYFHIMYWTSRRQSSSSFASLLINLPPSVYFLPLRFRSFALPFLCTLVPSRSRSFSFALYLLCVPAPLRSRSFAVPLTHPRLNKYYQSLPVIG